MLSQKNRTKWILMLSLLAGIGSMSGWCADYYVSTSGEDTHPGTQVLPWRSIQKAADTVQPGDTVTVLEGTYTDRVTTERDGAPDDGVITFQAEGQVIMNGFIVRHKYYRIQGFEITGRPVEIFQGAILLGSNSGYVEVLDNHLHDLEYGISPIQFYKGGNDPEVSAEYCTIRGNTFRNFNFHAFQVFGEGHLIEDNIIDQSNAWDAVRLFGRNHVFRKNVFLNISERVDVSNHADLFQTFGSNGDVSYNMLIENNLFRDCQCQIAQLVQGDGQSEDSLIADIRDWTFRNNVFDNVYRQANITMPGIKFYNNTFYYTTQTTAMVLNFGTDLTRGRADYCEVKNNLFIACGLDPYSDSKGWYKASNIVGFEADYNMVAGGPPSYSPKRTYSADPIWMFAEEHGINGGDPKFFSENDLRLQADSPAIDKGIVLSGYNYDFAETLRSVPWDIGAYEMSSGADAIAPPRNLRIIE